MDSKSKQLGQNGNNILSARGVEYTQKLILPVIPNSLLKSRDQFTPEGELLLRRHEDTGFVENALFDIDKMIYDGNYQNDQSNSEIFCAHMSDVYEIIKSRFQRDALLVEVGCGKGKFLELVKNDGFFTYSGYDSAYEGADVSIKKRYLVEEDRLDADVVVLRHTLEHIQKPHDFLSLLKKIFPPTALVFIEVPQFDWIVKNRVIFDLSYEHVNYFNTKSLGSMFESVIEQNDFFDGQYQYLFAPISSLNLDHWRNYDSPDSWRDYDFSVFYDQLNKVIKTIDPCERLWIWGAATKGVLFLYHLQRISPKLFRSVCGAIDLNSKKQGCFTPGTCLEVVSPSMFYERARDGDSVLVINPNYFNEVKDSIKKNTDKSIFLVGES